MGLNIKLLRGSFEALKPQAAAIADRFYENLWNDNPGADQLFANADMSKQKLALVNSLVFVVNHLEKPAELEKYLHALGARHVGYGAEEIHYDLVGAALLKTFAEFAGDLWTPELADQWTQAYGIIASIMKEGASVQRSLAASGMGQPAKSNVIPLQVGETPELPADLVATIHAEVAAAFNEAVAKEVALAWQKEVEQYDPKSIRADLGESTPTKQKSRRKKAS